MLRRYGWEFLTWLGVAAAAIAMWLILMSATPARAAVLSVTDITEAGVTMTLASAAGGGDSFANDSSGRVILVVTNGSGGSITVTCTPATASIAVPGYGTLTKATGCGAVGAGATKIFGPFPTTYNDSNGRVAVTYSGVTSLTVGAFRVPSP